MRARLGALANHPLTALGLSAFWLFDGLNGAEDRLGIWLSGVLFWMFLMQAIRLWHDKPDGDKPTRRQRIAATRLVLEYWRDHAMTLPGNYRIMAHPLACALAALSGEKDPGELGVDDDAPQYAAIRKVYEA